MAYHTEWVKEIKDESSEDYCNSSAPGNSMYYCDFLNIKKNNDLKEYLMY